MKYINRIALPVSTKKLLKIISNMHQAHKEYQQYELRATLANDAKAWTIPWTAYDIQNGHCSLFLPSTSQSVPECLEQFWTIYERAKQKRGTGLKWRGQLKGRSSEFASTAMFGIHRKELWAYTTIFNESLLDEILNGKMIDTTWKDYFIISRKGDSCPKEYFQNWASYLNKRLDKLEKLAKREYGK
ncbi:hypothetical protein D6825_04120 [Candidatus Woesearchaeota archaeon]|nr:MAG: hypothetical protein D6825_04120 [Candidatus Woesearchaeota archaeon]